MTPARMNVIVVGTMLSLIANAGAQNQPTQPPPATLPAAPTPPVQPPTDKVEFAPPESWQRASEVIGRPVTSDGVSVGKVEDFMIDPRSGRIVYSVSSFPGVPGGNGRLFPVPWQASRFSTEDNAFTLGLRPDRLPGAMSFPSNQWPDFGNQEFAVETFRSYNQTPWWPQTGNPADNPTPWAGGTGPSAQPGAPTPGAKLVSDPLRTPTYRDHWSQSPTTLQRASELRGREIRASDGTRVGTISEVVVDPQNGRVLYAIEESSGRRVPIPWNALQPRNDNTFQLSINAEQLKDAPGFEGEQWPDLTDRTWAENLHRYYRVDPYWNAAVAPSPTRP